MRCSLVMALTCRVSSEASDQFVVFDTIRSSLRFQKPVADGWMKVSELLRHTLLLAS